MDSAFAVPARYLAEMARRLSRHSAPQDGLLLMNPRFDQSGFAVEAAIDTAREVSRNDFVVLPDRRGRTAAVYARRPLEPADLPVLGALSLLDAELDRALLQAAFGGTVAIKEISPLDAGDPFANGFLHGSFDEAAMRLPARLAVEALHSATAAGATAAEARRALGVVPVLPYHAGDMVFLCQGLQALPVASAVVTLREFAPILEELLPFQRVVAVEGTPQNRNGFVVPSEQGHLVEIIGRARAAESVAGRRLDGYFLLLRPQRDHARSHFHLRQQLWFALGASCEADAEPFPSLRHQPRHVRCTPERRARVLIHFDGGWDLKSYPRPHRQQLLDLLNAEGFEPVVIGKPDDLDGCAFEPFRGLDRFRQLVASSAALLGCDSFPAHYAVNYGLPTVHLFGSTHPRNSGEADTPLSRVLHHDLPCVPCGQPERCNLDSGRSCRANPTPHEIVRALLELVGPPARDAELGEVRGAQAELELAAARARSALPARRASRADLYRADYILALERVALLVKLGARGRALDVGAGSGALARRLLEQGMAAA
jgi:hypothetical protein